MPTLRPPTEATVPNTADDANPLANALRRYYPVGPRGRAVWKLPNVDETTADAYTFNQPFPTVDGDLVAQGALFSTAPPRYPLGRSDSNLDTQTIDKVFLGGHIYTITANEATGLSAFLTEQDYTPGDWIT